MAEEHNQALLSMSVEAVFVRRQAYFQNGYRPFPVYSPSAVNRDGQPILNAGKRAKGKNWREAAAEDPPRAVRLRPDTDALNTGFLTGRLVGIDIDVHDQSLVDRVTAVIEKTLAATPLVRQGQAPKLALLFRTETLFSKKTTAKLQFPGADGSEPILVECLANGQGLVADGIHPVTGKPYRWLAEHPLDVRLEDLPTVTEDQVVAALTATEAILREAGLVDWVDPNAPIKEPAPERLRPARNNGTGGAGGFFHRINAAALTDPGAWVPQLFPKVERPAPNGAWRIPARLRNLPSSKQDLSVHPTEGIKDFHLDKSMSPIDVVIEYGAPQNALDAAFWLCGRLHRDPKDFGYRDMREEPPPPEPPDWGPPPPTAPPEGPSPEPVITVYAGERHLAANHGLAALHMARVRFFVRGHQLVRVCATAAKSADGDDISVPAILEVPLPYLSRALGQSARWMKFDNKGHLMRVDPPVPVVEQIATMVDEWPFPALHGIVMHPTLRPDGTLLASPGYDTGTGIYLALPADFVMPAIPERPTRRQAEAALDLLLELLSEFAFDSDTSRSVGLSLLITPIIRPAMTTAPIHAISAPMPGSGKSYLATLSVMLATGEHMPAIAQGGDDVETDKRLVAAALNGRPVIVLDNARHIVQGDFMCQVGERPLLLLRPLGTSTPVQVRNTFTTIIDGNNLTVADDLVRRVVRAVIDPNLAEPERREFRLDPVDMVRAERGRYVAACLTIVLAYIAAGSPCRLPRLASYRQWSDRVRSPLVWLGRADPVASMEELRVDDPVRQYRGLVFAAWAATPSLDIDPRGVTTKELIALADHSTDLHEALLLIAEGRGPNTGKFDHRKLGNWLRRHTNTIADGCKLEVDRNDKQRPRWRLVAQR